MSQENDRLKSLSDEELELEAQQINPKQWPKGHPVLRELISRKIKRDRTTLELAEAANLEAIEANNNARDSNNIAREANLSALEALRITKQDRTIAIIALIVAIMAIIIPLFLSK